MALSSTVPGKPDDGDGSLSYKLDRFRIGEVKATFKEENGSFFLLQVLILNGSIGCEGVR
jgi:hypothetical protein